MVFLMSKLSHNPRQNLRKYNLLISHNILDPKNFHFLENGNFWDPEYYEKSINYISLNFDEDYEIILTLRKPSDWLISNYLQYVVDGGHLKIDQYYLNNEEYKKSNQIYKFNIEKVNYIIIIE